MKSSKKRKQIMREPCIWSSYIYVNVARTDLGFIRFVTESYENVAYSSVVDKFRAIVKITFSPDMKQDVVELIETLPNVKIIFEGADISLK